MIKFLDLHKINTRFESEFQKGFKRFLDSGQYILGTEVARFESDFATYCGTDHCVGTANGLDALTLIFKSYLHLGKLRPNDEVIVPANTYIASILAIINAGLKPVLVEPDLQTYNLSSQHIEKHITSKTKAILVVHLYGQLNAMTLINTLAESRGLLVVEDAAQAHGAVDAINSRKAGNLSHAAAFSFYPSKNLGALGDGGAVTTNDIQLAETLKLMRNYGSSKKYCNEIVGVNSRLDELQAAFLNIKLKFLDADNTRRQNIAKRYLSEIKNKKITLPFYNGSKDHVFHVFVIRITDRANFMAYLRANNVEFVMHYPIAPHHQQALKDFRGQHLPITELIHNTIISIPISPVMTDKEVSKVVEIINTYQ